MKEIFLTLIENGLLERLTLNTKQPSNLKANIEEYNKHKETLNIDKRTFIALARLYTHDNNINKAFCPICGKLCNVKPDLSFHTTCSKECGRINSAKQKANTYNNKTNEEKLAIIEKRKLTCLKKFGTTSNLQSNTTIQTRINKYGANTPFASKEIQTQIANENINKHGTPNAFQWNTTKQKIKETKKERYDNPEYRNQEQITKTCQKKYGTNTWLTSEEGQKHRKNKCLTEHGVDHYMKVPEIKEKIKSTNNNKYGSDWYMNTEEFQAKTKEWCTHTHGVEYNCMRKDVRDKSNAKSKINQTWKELLNVDEEEFPIGKFSYDFRINKTLIEINPTITHNSTLSIFPKKEPKTTQYHALKTKLALDNGYNCIHVWDWDNPTKIKQLLTKAIYKVSRRKCTIQTIDKQTTDTFLNKYHLQNSCKGQTIALGLFHNEKLIAVSTYGKPRYNNNYQYEWLRFACNNEYIIHGGAANALHTHFINTYKPDSIISYCDNAKFNGKMFKHLKYTLLKQNQPAAHYHNIKSNQHFTANQIRKIGACKCLNIPQISFEDTGKNNNIIMLENNFLVVYDCGQASYIWKNT